MLLCMQLAAWCRNLLGKFKGPQTLYLLSYHDQYGNCDDIIGSNVPQRCVRIKAESKWDHGPTELLGGSELDQGLHRAKHLQNNHPDVGQGQRLHLISPSQVSCCPGFKSDPNTGTRLIVSREVTLVGFSSTAEFCSSWKQEVIINRWNRISFDLVIVGWASAKLSECPETCSSFPHGHFLGLCCNGVKTWLSELQGKTVGQSCKKI